MERFLGTEEHYFWLHDQVVPNHFCLTARISGNFRLERLMQSLFQAQRQHPLLRVAIAVAETGHPKFVEHIAPIPVRLVLRGDEQDWQREVEIELTCSFDWQTAPLIRVVLLQSKTVSELIVRCHHAIADGISIAYLIRDIMHGLTSKSSDTRTLLEAQPIDSFIALQEVVTDPQATLPREYSTKVTSRSRPHVRSVLLSAELTQQVCDRARQENTTVHGAISAAFLLAMARQQEGLFKCQSPIAHRSEIDTDP
ncbi:condensation domain-containing protein [Leptolyngbya sp. NIES-2104]|uniref:condensation domain-containing protein n=1 Tax=Leptolyngbya sp. NIES-2104 TaxID=1552121 RepID=UPI0006EC6393|nr:condensation domain-containing protein [Leptolyngbya sp. NIES-2104]GAP94248.1 condensation domain [Leptolyngbya sp. NIES-2104]